MAGPDIFLSYNREDAAIAKLFADAFAREGLEVWWDQTLRSGEAYDAVTEAALRGAKAVVVLWSPRSAASHWVRSEATIAHRAKTLVPATIEPCDKPVMFELTQTAELSHWRGEAGDAAWLTFLGDVRGMVGKESRALAAKAGPAPSESGSGMPVVAVLPITCRGGGEDLEFLAEDLTEDITRELSQSFYCNVIAASTMSAWRGRPIDHRAIANELGAAYLAEAKLQSVGNHVRLTAQLIEAVSDNMLWSSRFTCPVDEATDSPEQLTVNVSAELSESIGKFEMTRALAKQGNCAAWDHVLRARALTTRLGGSNRKAMEEAQQAVLKAPKFGMAHAMLANAITGRLQIERQTLDGFERETMVKEALEATRRAIELDGQNPAVLARISNSYGALGDAEAGLRLAQLAVRLAPNSPAALSQLGGANFMCGRTAEAIDAYRKSERIAQVDVDKVGSQALLGICLFIEGRSEEAEEAIDQSLALQPNFYLALRWKVIVAADLGKQQSARAAARFLRRSEPGKSIDEYLDSPRHLPIEHPRKYEAIEILGRQLAEAESDS